MHARLEAAVPASEEGGCFFQKRKYEPNMDKKRTKEVDADACQRLCQATSGCAFFSWDTGICTLQAQNAKLVDGRGTAGPKACATKRQCCFHLGQTTQLQLRLGTSFISDSQAAKALDDEVLGRSLEEVADEGRMVWRELLSRVDVVDAGDLTSQTVSRLRIFYTCLYRSLLFPRRLDEQTHRGIQHWSPYSGKVVFGTGVTDNGFWDTFRTVYQLLALAYPKELGELIDGWLNAFKAGGALPQWASPGYREGIMVGAYSDVVIADAMLKNVSGFDTEVAWQALVQDSDATTAHDHERTGFKWYVEKGYIPDDQKIGAETSRTLDYAYADAAVASVAELRGDPLSSLRVRSKRALHELFDVGTRLMGQRNSDGRFTTKTSDTWGFGFVEGSAFHHSFPSFDLQTLTNLHGGKENFLRELWRVFTIPASFEVGSYKRVIHEMREFQILGMGQYAHSNQPVHHFPYLFAMLGDQNTTALLVRQILARAYAPTGFSGDEDNGEMGAWYVLSALGLFAAAVGTTEDYVLGAVPLFPQVRLVDLGVIIEAPAAMLDFPTISEVMWRSEIVVGSLPYSCMRKGGVLRFMSPEVDVVRNAGVAHLRSQVVTRDTRPRSYGLSWLPLGLSCVALGAYSFRRGQAGSHEE